MPDLWIALTWPHDTAPARPQPGTPPETLICWALGYTPRVSTHDSALLLEVGASLRLFGGRGRLLARLRHEAADWAVPCIAVAPTALGATALLSTGQPWAEARHPRLTSTLDALPLTALAATRAQVASLHSWGCTSLGDVRQLPRDGLRRRLPAEVLRDLDVAYGQAPPILHWLTLPDHFAHRLSWSDPLGHAPALVFVAQRLLRALEGWLRARHRGALCLQLSGWGEAREPALSVSIGCSTPTQDAAVWSRLLSERLQRTHLSTPVLDIELAVVQHAPISGATPSLLNGPPTHGQMDWAQLVDRLSARLGPTQVRQGHLVDDPRPLHGQQWRPAQRMAGPATATQADQPKAPPRATPPRPGACWEPAWLFDPPQVCPSGIDILGDAQPLATHWWGESPQHGRLLLGHAPNGGLLWLWLAPGTQPAASPEQRLELPWQQVGAYG